MQNSNESLLENKIEEIEKQIEELQKEKDSRFIKLPFSVNIQHARRKKIVFSSKTDSVSYDEFMRMIYGFKSILKNPKYNIKESSSQLVHSKSQMGEWWDLNSFIATASFDDFKTLLNMYDEVLERMQAYKNQINNLKAKEISLLNEENEKE